MEKWNKNIEESAFSVNVLKIISKMQTPLSVFKYVYKSTNIYKLE